MTLDALAEGIVRKIGAKTILHIGRDAGLVAALRARGCEAFGIDPSIASAPPTGPLATYDLIVCIEALDGLEEEQRALAVVDICRATGDVLFASRLDRSQWSQRFYAQGFYVDVEFDPGFISPRALRLRKALAGLALNSGNEEVRRLQKETDDLYLALDERDRVIGELNADLNSVRSTVTWRVLERLPTMRETILRRPVLRPIYWILRRSAEVMLDEGPRGVAQRIGVKLRLALRGQYFLVKPRRPVDFNTQYNFWLRKHELTEAHRLAIEAAITSLPYTPRVSVLAVLDPCEESRLLSLLAVMRDQIYPYWELCVAIPPSADTTALSAATVTEPRLHIAKGHDPLPLHAAALERATGDFVALLRASDRLAPEALFEVVRRLNEDPDLDVIYTDEDRLTHEGQRVDPFFKPDWSPDLLLVTNYVGHFFAVRRKLLDEIGGFRGGFEGGQEYDVALRATERTGRIAHISKVLYHHRDRLLLGVQPLAPLVGDNAGKRAIEDALHRRGLPGQVEIRNSGYHERRCYRVSYELRSQPLVSIIIPTRDKWRLLDLCLRSVAEKTTYRNYEIVIVDNNSKDQESLAYLDSLAERCRVYRFSGRFNYAKINNFGVAQARGDYFLFLNNDIEVIAPDWLTAMLMHGQRSEVGIVGAKLLYPDGGIQHAGVVVGINGVAGHPFRRRPGTVSELRPVDLRSNCSAVTAACMLMPRRVFEKVGGFDERFRVVFNDVDLCLRIRQSGYLIVYEPDALLYHHESATRGKLDPSKDHTLFRKLWAQYIERGDPYYNPNFSLTSEDVELRSGDER